MECWTQRVSVGGVRISWRSGTRREQQRPELKPTKFHPYQWPGWWDRGLFQQICRWCKTWRSDWCMRWLCCFLKYLDRLEKWSERRAVKFSRSECGVLHWGRNSHRATEGPGRWLRVCSICQKRSLGERNLRGISSVCMWGGEWRGWSSVFLRVALDWTRDKRHKLESMKLFECKKCGGFYYQGD